MMSKNGIGLRADIQALRAFSVLVVVIFHVSPGLLPGGFLGVDIFFVISGYLIIPGILKEIESGRFSFKSFYKKRLTRLMPAYSVFLLLSIPVAVMVLPDSELYDAMISALSSVFYFSNYFFYFKADYFDDALKFSPYLHTWSLSVEEQFYILTPILLTFFFFLRVRKEYFLLLTFCSSILIFFVFSSFDQSWNFYSIFTRIWQFLVGAFSAIYLPRILGNVYRKLYISMIFSMMMILVVVLYDDSLSLTAYTVLVTLLAALVLAIPVHGPLGRYVYNKPVVKIGDWSYSIYLYHWVIVVAYRSWLGNPKGIFDELTLLVLSIIFGAISYHMVERPSIAFFRKSAWSSVSIYATLVVILLSSVTFYLSVQYKDIPSQYSIDVDSERKKYREGVCFFNSRYSDLSLFSESCRVKGGEKNIALIGDSHAAHWYTAIREVAPKELHVAQYNASGCRPFVVESVYSMCEEVVSKFYADMKRMKKGSLVILSARWRLKELSTLKDSLDYIVSSGHVPVVFGPIIEYEQSLPRILELSKDPNEYSNYRIALSLDHELARLVDRAGGIYISILAAICASEGDCLSTVNTPVGGVPVQVDYGHLSSSGALEVLHRTSFEIEMKQQLPE